MPSTRIAAPLTCPCGTVGVKDENDELGHDVSHQGAANDPPGPVFGIPASSPNGLVTMLVELLAREMVARRRTLSTLALVPPSDTAAGLEASHALSNLKEDDVRESREKDMVLRAINWSLLFFVL